MSNQVTPTQNPPIHFPQKDLVFESGGIRFIIHISADINGNILVDPNNPVTPPIDNPPVVTPAQLGGMGLDMVKLMFSENVLAKCKPFYINLNNPDENNQTFATTYGGDIVKFQTMKEGNLQFVRNVGHKQTYKSKAPDGKSCRFHITPDGGMFGEGKYSWKDSPLPQYLYSEKCYYNFEMTAIARVGPALGTHQSFAFKIRSRPDGKDDSKRSTIEFCMPNDQKADAYVNYNYDHKTYSKVSGVKQYTDEGKITVGQWIGVKLVSIVADDRKSHWMGLYVNTNPIESVTGLPDNQGWKLKAEYTDKGIKDYKNIPAVWGGMTNYLRIDGYEYVDLYRYSQIEINKGPLTNPAMLDLAPNQNFKLAAPTPENPADFNSPDDFVPQQDPSNPQAPPQTQVTNK